MIKTITNLLQIKYSSKKLLDYVFWSFVIGFTISGSIPLVVGFSLTIFLLSYFISKEISEVTLEFSLGFFISFNFWNYFFQVLPSSKESLNTDHWYHLYATYAPLELILKKFRVIQMSRAFFIFENNIF